MAIPNDTGAGSATGNLAGTGGTMPDTGADSRARELALKARERAGEVVEQYTDRARSGVEGTMSRVASELGTVANSLRQCSSDMNRRDNSMLLPYVEQVADQVDRLSSFLETRRVDDLARDVERFARRNPAVFLGACFGVGILAARFLKASRPDYGPTSADGVTPAGYGGSRRRTAPDDGGWVAYGEATYTEPESGFGDRAGYDAQRSTNDPNTSNGAGAAYSGPLRGTQGTVADQTRR